MTREGWPIFSTTNRNLYTNMQTTAICCTNFTDVYMLYAANAETRLYSVPDLHLTKQISSVIKSISYLFTCKLYNLWILIIIFCEIKLRIRPLYIFRYISIPSFVFEVSSIYENPLYLKFFKVCLIFVYCKNNLNDFY